MTQPTPESTGNRPLAGRDYPADLAQLLAWFSDDESCVDYLQWLRWPEGICCPRCLSAFVNNEPDNRLRCKKCWYRFSATAGTIFDKTRTPLTGWFQTAWLMTAGKSGVCAAHLHRVLPISSYQTAWSMLGKLRSVMSTQDSSLLSGRVEVDESFFGGHRPGRTGRGAAGKTLVAGAIEIADDGWGRARLAIIPDASAASLREFITANIAPGSTIVSDGWRGYGNAVEGYAHEPVSVWKSGLEAHASLPAVHRLFALVKRMIEGTYQGSGSVGHLQEYLDEFVFRFNRRHSTHRGLVFMRLLERAVKRGPVTYRNLVRKPEPKAVHPRGVSGPHALPGSMEREASERPWRSPRATLE